MDYYEPEVEALEARFAREPRPARPVVFYGSSSIRQWVTLASDFPGTPVVNAGFGGSTLEACSWFFWRLVRPLRPSALVVYAGDNDLGDGRSPAFVEGQLAHLLAQLEPGCGPIPFLLLSVKPSPARWALRAAIEDTNQRFASACATRSESRFVDVFTPMLRDGEPRAELFEQDGLHLSRQGYALWRELVAQARHGLF